MKKLYSKSERRKGRLIALLLAIFIGFITVSMLSGCKAWRTITTTASYTVLNDSTKTATTITSKTVEEYQGKKK